MGYFKIKKVVDLKSFLKDHESGKEVQIDEADLSLNIDEKLVQFEHIEVEKTKVSWEAKHGLFKMVKMGYSSIGIEPASFYDEVVMAEYDYTKQIVSRADLFFSKVSFYKDFGLFPKRGVLLYGSPGTGKTLAISRTCKHCLDSMPNTAVLLWHTDTLDSSDVSDFLEAIDYEKHGIERLVLVAEDIGGGEVESEATVKKASSSLLALLDNSKGVFTKPTLLLATTNFPENFLEALTNRPQRFDDLIEAHLPNGEFRARFLDFFSKGSITDDVRSEIKMKKYEKMSVAHLKEIVVRKHLDDLTYIEALERVFEQSQRSVNSFRGPDLVGGIGGNL